MIGTIRRMWEHLAWADHLLLQALEEGPPPADALREYCHILGANEVWLARLEQRPAKSGVWPEMELTALRGFVADLHAAWSRYLDGLDEAALPRPVWYTNSAGQSYQTPVQDILLHVALHAQYHRGKINLLLRQAGFAPAPTDYIGFVRGGPAATTTVRPSKPPG